MSLPSILPCLRQRILGVAPGIRFLGNPAGPVYPVDTCSTPSRQWRRQGGLLRSECAFGVALGLCYSPGLTGVNPGQHLICQAPSLYHFGQADNPRRLVHNHDDSDAHLLALSIATGSQG